MKSKYELYLGDCINVLQELIDKGYSVDCIITDPPYGVTSCKWDTVLPLEKIWNLIHKISKETANIILFSQQPYTTTLNYSNIKEFRYELIWKKQQCTYPMCAKQRVMPIHENISIFYKKHGCYNPQMRTGYKNYSGFSSNEKKLGEVYSSSYSKHRTCENGDRYPVTVLEYNNVRNTVHPTQKPIDLLEFLVKTFSNENDIILDFCMGSGSTGVASIKNNRRFIGIELEEKYYNIAEQRIKETPLNINYFM